MNLTRMPAGVSGQSRASISLRGDAFGEQHYRTSLRVERRVDGIRNVLAKDVDNTLRLVDATLLRLFGNRLKCTTQNKEKDSWQASG